MANSGDDLVRIFTEAFSEVKADLKGLRTEIHEMREKAEQSFQTYNKELGTVQAENALVQNKLDAISEKHTSELNHWKELSSTKIEYNQEKLLDLEKRVGNYHKRTSQIEKKLYYICGGLVVLSVIAPHFSSFILKLLS